MVLQMTQARTPPARTGKCCSRNTGDMTSPVVLMKRVMKKWRMLVSWCRQCSCWSVDDSITPATNAPSSEDKPCTQHFLFDAILHHRNAQWCGSSTAMYSIMQGARAASSRPQLLRMCSEMAWLCQMFKLTRTLLQAWKVCLAKPQTAGVAETCTLPHNYA